MKRFKFTLGLMAVCGIAFAASAVQAQCATGNCGTGGSQYDVCSSGTCGTGTGGCLNCKPGAWGEGCGTTSPTCMVFKKPYPNPAYALWLADRDHFSPNRFYPYSRGGIDASWTHEWNKARMNCVPWHGQNSYWRYQQPTALVVPPVAAFQTSYNWGVGQTRSLPIAHQFGRYGAGGVGGAAPGQFQNTPYWPSSTEQFGVYPVRAPW